MEKTIIQLVEEIIGHELNRVASLDLLNHGLDSLAIVQLALNMEKKFSIELMTDSFKIENFRSVDSIKLLIQSKTGLQ